MRLAVKLVGVFVLVTIGLLGINGYILVNREVARFENEMKEDAHHLGVVMEKMVFIISQATVRGKVVEFINTVGSREQQTQVRWVWFDAPQGNAFEPRVNLRSVPREHLLRETSYSIQSVDGENLLCTYYPIHADPNRLGGLELVGSLRPLEAYKREIILNTMGMMGGLLLLSACIMAWFGIVVLGRPLRKLTQKARRVGTGDLTDDVKVRGHDELSELAGALNSMCHQLTASQEQLRHADRLRTVGRLASGIAHELGTPLNVISGQAGLIASGRLPAEKINDSARAIKAESQRISGIIRQLLDFARRSAPRRAVCNLGQLLRSTIDLLEPLAAKRNVRFVAEQVADDAVADVDSGQIQQVLTNLLVNAVDAMPNGGDIQIRLEAVNMAEPPVGSEALAGPYFRIEVQDPGGGIRPADLPHIFEPFFTTKEVGEGTGLGLSISYGMVQEHGGWIDVESRLSQGTTFRVYLPQKGIA